MARLKDVVILAEFRNGPFPSEMTASFKLAGETEPLEIVVPRFYCRRPDGTPFGDGEPGKKVTARGLLAAVVVRYGAAGLVVVNVPDGSVVPVAKVIVRDYPPNWDPKEDLNAEEEGNG